MRFPATILALLSAPALSATAAADPTVPNVEAEARTAHAQAIASIAQMEATARRVRLLLQWARERGTRTQVACADEGLSRADVALRGAREHARLADEAWERGEATLARREVLLLSACREAARTASETAGACVGPSDKTIVSVRTGHR